MKQIDFIPFDPVNKRTMATIVDSSGKTQHYAKGAPPGYFGIWPNRTPYPLARYQATVANLAGKGYRALGVAESDDGEDVKIAGLVSPMDPPRPDARRALIDAAKALGVNVKMVTGDDVAIGDQIAAQLDLGDHLLVASDVFKDDGEESGMLSASVMDAVERQTVSAGYFPTQIQDTFAEKRFKRAGTSSG